MTKWKCHRMFSASRIEPSNEDLTVLMREIDKNRAGKPLESPMPAAYTYFGQLVDHDLTRMLHLFGPEQGPVDVYDLKLGVSPSLDLDTLYGKGFEDPIIPFNKSTGQFLLRCSNDDHFLLRDDDGYALIADHRNDENVFISRMLVLFMLLHNRIAGWVRREHGLKQPEDIFKEARKHVILIYQYLVLHDFARTILPDVVYRNVIDAGASASRKYNVCLNASTTLPSLPLEFATAAFRLHGWVRHDYVPSLEPFLRVPIRDLMNPDTIPSPGNARAGASMDRTIDWRLFIKSKTQDNSELVMNLALGLTPVVPKFGEMDVPLLTLKRGREFRIPSGQAIYQAIVHDTRPEVVAMCGKIGPEMQTLDGHALFDLSDAKPLIDNTPLWFYLMLEALNENQSSSTPEDNDPPESRPFHKLGKLGGWLVADTLCAAMKSADVRLEDEDMSKSAIWSLLREADYYQRDPGSDLTFQDIVRLVYRASNCSLPMKRKAILMKLKELRNE
jgi:hypothetical protein